MPPGTGGKRGKSTVRFGGTFIGNSPQPVHRTLVPTLKTTPQVV